MNHKLWLRIKILLHDVKNSVGRNLAIKLNFYEQ